MHQMGQRLTFSKNYKKISNVMYEHLVLVGDFNGTINNELDRSD